MSVYSNAVMDRFMRIQHTPAELGIEAEHVHPEPAVNVDYETLPQRDLWIFTYASTANAGAPRALLWCPCCTFLCEKRDFGKHSRRCIYCSEHCRFYRGEMDKPDNATRSNQCPHHTVSVWGTAETGGVINSFEVRVLKRYINSTSFFSCVVW